MRRLAPFVAPAVAASALAFSGCGGATSPLDEALGHFPKNAPLAVAIKTDLKSSQYHNLGKIVDRFPFSGQVKDSVKRSLERSGDVNFDRDVKPQLGNDLVVGTPDTHALADGQITGNDLAVTLKVKDGGKVRTLEQQHGRKVGSHDGADIYEDNQGGFTAINGDVVTGASNRATLYRALDERGNGDRLSHDTFDSALKGLPSDALVRVYSDLQAAIGSGPRTASARRVKWVNALHTLGATGSAGSNSLAVDFNVKTNSSGLSNSDLPLPAGTATPGVVSRAGEISVGLHNPAQVAAFAQQVAQAVNPGGFAQYAAAKAQIERSLGVNLDRDVLAQLSGDAAATIAPNRVFGVRAVVRDPAAFRRTLAKLTRLAPRFARGAGLGPVGVARRGGFTAISRPGGRSIIFGVFGNAFVLSNQARGAARLVSVSPSAVPGTSGSLVTSADARSVANRVIARLGGIRALAAPLVTGPLGMLTGSVNTSTSGMKGHLTLGFR